MQQALSSSCTCTVVEVPVEESKYITINSNHWNFYRKPSPDKPMFVEVGNTIAKGDVLCVIE
jgi:acetyl-CoA carboxylase biotin carboxyl carrier protein